MSEPTGFLTFESLVTRVAVEAGIASHGSSGQERANVPTDPHDLDKCKEVVNDGIRMFISDAPANGWRWMRRIASVTMTATRITGTADSTSTTTLVDLILATTYDADDDLKGYYIYVLTGTGAGSYAVLTGYTALTGTCTVAEWLDSNGNTGGTTPAADDTFAITPVETVEGDISRYPLPENFGGDAAGRIEYASSTNHASIIDWCDESYIRSRRSVSVITGYPRHAAIRPLEPVTSSSSAKRRFEIIFDPQPVSADTVEFPYTLHFNDLQLEAGEASSVSGTTGLLDDDLDNLYPDDYFLGWRIKIVSGTGRNATAIVDNYTGGTAQFDVVNWLDVNGGTSVADPAANSVYVVEPANNLHPAGYRFDEHILAACMAKAELEFEDITASYVEQYHKKSLSGAYRIDARSAPRQLGSMNLRERRVRERMWNNIEYN